MSRNKIKNIILCIVFGFSGFAFAQNTQPQPQAQKQSAAKAVGPAGKKKIKLDYESDVVMGAYDTPDASFINSRRMIKYKELFNRRTNFIEEIDSNKGLFNEYQK